MPKVSGVTSSRRTSPTSPLRTPAWIAAPRATASSGFIPLTGSRPKNCLSVSCTFGILVWPPTRITSLIWLACRPASARACRQGSKLLSIKSADSCSNLALLSVMLRCLGPDASAVTKGRFTSVWLTVDSSFFTFSAASFMRCSAILSCVRSMPDSFLNSSHIQSITLWSISSPPR